MHKYFLTNCSAQAAGNWKKVSPQVIQFPCKRLDERFPPGNKYCIIIDTDNLQL